MAGRSNSENAVQKVISARTVELMQIAYCEKRRRVWTILQVVADAQNTKKPTTQIADEVTRPTIVNYPRG